MSNFCPKQLHRGAHPEMFADTRRGEFRRWLDYEGILDAFTKLFVTLYDADPRPESPIDFAIDFFGSTPRAAVEAAVAENARLKEEIKAAEARIAEIQKEFEDAD